MQRNRAGSASEVITRAKFGYDHKRISVSDRMAMVARTKPPSKTKWVTHIFLLLAIIAYTGVGAVLFMVFEGGPEAIMVDELKKSRNEAIDDLIKLIKSNAPELDKKATTEISKHESVLQGLYEKNPKLLIRGKDEESWDILGSAFFCTTVFTTIGYGHIVPTKTGGKILAVVYALLGIPLFLTLLADYGKLLTKVLKFMWLYVRRFYYTGSFRKPTGMIVRRAVAYDDETDLELGGTANEILSTMTDEFNLPIYVALTVFAIYMILGGVIFMVMEEWNFLDSFYFVFVSLSTIGFGDLVPAGRDSQGVLSVYLVVGLSLASMCINVCREKISETVQQASSKLGEAVGIEFQDADDDDDEEEDDKNRGRR